MADPLPGSPGKAGEGDLALVLSHGDVGASGGEKGAAAVGLVLDVGSFVLPHPAKAARGGEDAAVVDAATGLLCVCDGVGGWARVPGADAGLVARTLCKTMATALTSSGESGDSDSTPTTTLLEAAERAHAAVIAAGVLGYILKRGGG